MGELSPERRVFDAENIPAQKIAPQKRARFSQENVYEQWTKGSGPPPRKGSQKTFLLVGTVLRNTSIDLNFQD